MKPQLWMVDTSGGMRFMAGAHPTTQPKAPAILQACKL